jgi:hypothetical protein
MTPSGTTIELRVYHGDPNGGTRARREIDQRAIERSSDRFPFVFLF